MNECFGSSFKKERLAELHKDWEHHHVDKFVEYFTTEKGRH
jgi:hypothetical protein